MPSAPTKFVEWLSRHEHVDRLGLVYKYHPRSDAHSKALCGFILQDLSGRSHLLKAQLDKGVVAWGTNVRFRFPNTNKDKTLDLAIGHARSIGQGTTAPVPQLRDVLLACEAKSVMTEHAKSQPRVFDELNSSHGIVHAGRADSIAAGITVVNIARRFASPLRQIPSQRELVVTEHNQPEATSRMVRHLRGLPVRSNPGAVGFDAYATIVVECDNQGRATLWTRPPAPQAGDVDSYDEFVKRIVRLYEERFTD